MNQSTTVFYGKTTHNFHLVNPSPWPFITSLAAFSVAFCGVAFRSVITTRNFIKDVGPINGSTKKQNNPYPIADSDAPEADCDAPEADCPNEQENYSEYGDCRHCGYPMEAQKPAKCSTCGSEDGSWEDS